MDPRLDEISPADHAGRWWRWSERLPVALRGPFRSRFFRFLLVGGLNTVFGYAVFAALILLKVPYPVAAFCSTVLGVLFNFKTYGSLVFGSHDNSLIFRFFLVYGITYLVGVALLAAGKAMHVPVLVTAAVLAAPMAGFSFLLNRALVFRRREGRLPAET